MGLNKMVLLVIVLFVITMWIIVWKFLISHHFFKSKEELVTESFDVGQIIVTIFGTNGNRWTRTFVGSVNYHDWEDGPGVRVKSAQNVAADYIFNVYGEIKLFGDDDGNLIPEHRISFIKTSDTQKHEVEFTYYKRK